MLGPLAVGVGCRPLEDAVFELDGLDLSAPPRRVPEGAGLVSIPVSLTRPATREISVSYHTLDLTAQSDCQVPDFEVTSGKLVWPTGERVATLQIWIDDDELAETDEQLKLVFDDPAGALPGNSRELVIEIADDDRTLLIDARASFGVEPNSTLDQSNLLQNALDEAATSGRGVVLLAPGDYEITSVALRPGTTLSGPLAQLHRPPSSAADVKTLVIEHSGELDSAPTLVEGVSIDGRRDRQGAYVGYERELANLVAVAGDPKLRGRLQLSLENLTVSAGTGDGINVGTNVDGRLCHVHGQDLWRDMLSVRGGDTRLRVRDLDANASQGKSGLWFDGGTRGFSGTRHLDIELEDLRLETGDVEIDVSDGSRVTVERLVMTEAPFRLAAPGSAVRISNSVLMSGMRVPSHNYWGQFQDVEVRNSTLRVSESAEAGGDVVASETAEADRELTAVRIEWPAPAAGVVATGTLLFEGCFFDRANDVEASDTVYAVTSRSQGPTIRVVSSTLAPSFKDWFAPDCADCRLEP
jgi:Calx-beta domain